MILIIAKLFIDPCTFINIFTIEFVIKMVFFHLYLIMIIVLSYIVFQKMVHIPEDGDDIGPAIPESLRRDEEVENEQEEEPSSSDFDEPPTKRTRTEQDENEGSEKQSGSEAFVVPNIPHQRKTLKFEDTYLRSVPRGAQYEKSFMHRDTVTHVFATQ